MKKEIEKMEQEMLDSYKEFEAENINFLYINVVNNCKFISKKDSWFVEYKEIQRIKKALQRIETELVKGIDGNPFKHTLQAMGY